MTLSTTSTSDFELGRVIAQDEAEILAAYQAAQQHGRSASLISSDDLRQQCLTLLHHLKRGTSYDPHDPTYAPLREFLSNMSRSRARQGFTPVETATFVFSLKDALLPALQRALVHNPAELARHTLAINRLLDQLGLLTFEAYVQGREGLIREQSQAILELSTPVVQLWQGILALPLIGSVDTARSQQIMEDLLTRITETGSTMVIMDITGVPIVDTAVAKHLLQTVAAARLLGAESVIVGVSSRIAQTIVHLGIDLSEVVTRTSMARGLEYALARTGHKVVKVAETLPGLGVEGLP